MARTTNEEQEKSSNRHTRNQGNVQCIILFALKCLHSFVSIFC